MKILLAIDSSALSEAVTSEVEARPWPPGTEVCVLTVIDLLALTTSVGYLEPFIKSENDAANKFVQAVSERLRNRGISSTAIAVEGYPGASIIQEAEKWGADFVFVGSHGHSGFVRFLLGSIAKAVVQNAPCSVEIVRHPRHDKDLSFGTASGSERAEVPLERMETLATARGADEHDKAAEPGSEPERGAMRILFATDGSEHAAAAARSIAARPWPTGSEVRVISVVEPMLHAGHWWHQSSAVADRVREDSVNKCQEAVSNGENLIASAGVRVETAVLQGAPKKSIVEEAKEWGAHLLVVGSHGRRGMTRYLLGSVSEAVAMHAHCSVEVIRDRELLKESS